MTFEPARPRHTLPFAGTEYELVGSMELVEAAEHALKRGVGQIAVDIATAMPTHELVRLIAAILTACGYKTSPEQVKERLWNTVGISGDENSRLRLHLYAFLSVCLAPPEARERKAKDVGELIGKLEAASRGERTRKPASGASGGRRRSSGGRPPGT